MERNGKPVAPDRLTMDLFAPGMTAIHRAGLGGLACTLKAMEPQFPLGGAPWEATDRSVTLLFGKPGLAGEYLKRLFAFAFQVRKDGLIRLPGRSDGEPSAAVLADLQAGLNLTFLQHGKTRDGPKQPITASYDPEEVGGTGVTVAYLPCEWFKHQNGWQSLVHTKGFLKESVAVEGPLSPGTAVRHVAFTPETTVTNRPELLMPLYFAIVGCLPLPVNRGVGVLLVPDVQDLSEFIYDRPIMTPTTARECQVGSAADAALQMQVRLRGRRQLVGTLIPGCTAMTFAQVPWTKPQKARVATVRVSRVEDSTLDRFGRALDLLPNRIVSRTIETSSGRGKSKLTIERKESFRADSVIRPLIAENLNAGRKWHTGFRAIASTAGLRKKVSYEAKGLDAMIRDDLMWDDERERVVIRAVHSALASLGGQIAELYHDRPQLKYKKYDSEREKWGRIFAGSMTADQFRRSLADMFRRAGTNRELQDNWQQLLPMLQHRNWEHARDLALIGLCSYQASNTASASSPEKR